MADALATNAHYYCTICMIAFSRGEHFTRHMASHSARRPYSCGFCDKCFKRSDVLKRHWKTCRARLDIGAAIPVPSHQVKGRKRTSCDRCCRMKRACGGQDPCVPCTSKKEHCSYSLIETANRCSPARPKISTALEELHSLGDDDNTAEAPDEMVKYASIRTNAALTSYGSSSLRYDPFDLHNWSLSGNTSDLDWQELMEEWPQTPSLPAAALSQETAMDAFPSLPAVGEGLFRIDFITTFAKCTGFATCFECGSTTQRRKIVTGHFSFQSEGERLENVEDLQDGNAESDISWLGHTEMDEVQSHLDSRNLFDMNVSMYDQPLQTQTHFKQSVSISDGGFASPWSSWLRDPLAIKTHEIVRSIKEVVCHKARNSIITTKWSALLEAMCYKMFGPPQIRKSLALFWSAWYPNCPILHRPTFVTQNAPTGLLAAMILIGSSVSSEESDRDCAKPWYDIVEELVFEDDIFGASPMKNSNCGSSHHPLDRNRLAKLQAAFLMCGLQHWEAREVSGQRIQKQRHNTLITAARDLATSIQSVSPMANLDPNEFDWANFALREEAIRTFTHIFLLETSFVIFDNCPPRLFVHELKVDLACSEESFRAYSAEECISGLISDAQSNPKPQSILSIVETLCQANPSPEVIDSLSRSSVLNLFTVVAALSSLCHGLISYAILGCQMAPVRYGLMNWIQAWFNSGHSVISTLLEDNNGSHNSELWKRAGITQHAPELWCLLCLVVDKLESKRSNEGLLASEGTPEGLAKDLLEGYIAKGVHDKQGSVFSKFLKGLRS